MRPRSARLASPAGRGWASASDGRTLHEPKATCVVSSNAVTASATIQGFSARAAPHSSHHGPALPHPPVRAAVDPALHRPAERARAADAAGACAAGAHGAAAVQGAGDAAGHPHHRHAGRPGASARRSGHHRVARGRNPARTGAGRAHQGQGGAGAVGRHPPGQGAGHAPRGAPPRLLAAGPQQPGAATAAAATQRQLGRRPGRARPAGAGVAVGRAHGVDPRLGAAEPCGLFHRHLARRAHAGRPVGGAGLPGQ